MILLAARNRKKILSATTTSLIEEAESPARLRSARYSLIIGSRLGLADRELLGLATAGLLHDVGTMLAPEGSSPAKEAHPLVGALALGALPDDECTAILVALEHHMGADGTGFPARPAEYPVHPYSQIVAVADRYDNLVRPAEGEPLHPDQAAAAILREATGGPLEPALARVFLAALGAIPVSTVVRLSDFSVGVVREPGADPLRPQIRLVIGPNGSLLRPVLDVDLAEDERYVVEALPESLLGLHAADYA